MHTHTYTHTHTMIHTHTHTQRVRERRFVLFSLFFLPCVPCTSFCSRSAHCSTRETKEGQATCAPVRLRCDRGGRFFAAAFSPEAQCCSPPLSLSLSFPLSLYATAVALSLSLSFKTDRVNRPRPFRQRMRAVWNGGLKKWRHSKPLLSSSLFHLCLLCVAAVCACSPIPLYPSPLSLLSPLYSANPAGV